jgi:hypothetical protein
MAVDYLKNYLNIDPNDYSAMQSRIAGTPVVDDQFARIDSSPSVNSLKILACRNKEVWAT